jgi:hypothetical protein
MYMVLRRYTSSQWTAFAGGLLFGFSPYVLGHAHRHVFLTFLPLLPLLIPLLDDWLVRPRRNPWWSGVLVGLVVAAEFLISPEVALLAIVFALVGLAALAVRYRTAVRERLAPLGKGLLSGGAVLAVFVAYPVYLMVAGPRRPVGEIHGLSSLNRFHGDLVAPVVPTQGEFFSPSGSGAKLVGGSFQENGFYLGVPLLLLLIVAAVRFRRVPLVLASVVVAIVAFVFSLGPTLTVNGHVLVRHMPFELITKLPLFQNIEAARLSLFLQMPAAIVFAIALDRWRGRGWRRVLVPVAAVVALVPLVPALPFVTARVHVPRFFTTDAVRMVPAGTIALTYPYSKLPNNDAMFWQTASNMRFRIIGGMAFVPGPGGRSVFTARPPAPPNIDALLLAGRLREPLSVHDEALLTRVRDFVAKYRVGVVLVDPSARRAAEVSRVFAAALGRPPLRREGMEIWVLAARS